MPCPCTPRAIQAPVIVTFLAPGDPNYAFKPFYEKVKARGYNLDIKNPRAVDDGPGDADSLLEEYRATEAAVEALQRQLRDRLAEALGR